MESAVEVGAASPSAHESIARDDSRRRDIALVSARVERLPFSRWHGKVLAVVGSAHLFDSFDALTIAFVLPVLAVQWQLSPSQAGLLISAGYIGQLLGALIMGPAAERFGRIPTLRAVLFILALFSLGSAFAWGVGVFVVLRFLQGIGLGGEVPIAATYMNEVCPAKHRGRIIYALQSGFSFGSLLTAGVAVWLIPRYGWQSMFFVGTLPIILAVLLPRLVPESPRWLAMNGRLPEAEKIASDMESYLPADVRAALPAPVVVTPPIQKKASFKHLLTDGYATRTITVWVIACCASLTGYGIIAWMPTLYRTEYHLPVEIALRYGLFSNVATFLGTLSGILLIDFIGRRKTFMLGFLGGAVPMLYLAYSGTAIPPFHVMIYASTSFFFITFLLCGLYVYAPEIYPTRMRATGVGAASAWLRIGSIVGPILVGSLLTYSTINSVFLMFGGAAVVGGLAVMMFGIETKGKALDEISS